MLQLYIREHKKTGIFSQKKHNIVNIYTQYENMLADDNIDAVYIASPTMCHAAQAISALLAGKHVLCEKMICATLQEFSEMKEAKERSGKILIEAMRPDFDEILAKVTKEVRNIGKIKDVKLEYCQYSSRYDKFKAGEIMNAFDPKIKNSALSDIGIYPLHFAISLFGSPKTIKSSGTFLHNGFLGSGVSVLSYDDFEVRIEYSKTYEGENISQIVGEDGTITFDKINEPTYYTLKRCNDAIKTYHAPNDKSNMVSEIAEFIRICDCDRRLGDNLISVTEKTMVAVEDIYSSLGVDF